MTDYISNINSIPIGGKQLNGKWEVANLILMSSVTIASNATQTFDLSEILTDANYDYEVIGLVWIGSNSTNGQQSTLAVKNGDGEFQQRMGSDYVRSGANGILGGGNYRVVIHGSNRSISITNIRSYTCPDTHFTVAYFRRVGKNI